MTAPRYFGLEAEKSFVSISDGEPFAVGDGYFEALGALKTRDEVVPRIKYDEERAVAVQTGEGVEGLDGYFHLGESSTVPIAETEGGLSRLDALVVSQLRDVQTVLGAMGGGVLNMSNHPLMANDEQTIARFAISNAPSYARHSRGWDRAATVNARVQNSPSTSVFAHEAAAALTTMIGLGAVTVALYANSPFEYGSVSTMQESRLKVWPGYFARSVVANDRKLYLPPQAPIQTLRDYFAWTFGPDTSMYCVKAKNDQSTNDEKRATIVDGYPSLLSYLAKPQWQGIDYQTGAPVTVVPTIGHMERNQFMQFCGSRLRFSLNDPDLSPDEFLTAMAGSGEEVEAFMTENATNVYLEARDPGANFADLELADLDASAARSVFMSPSALQAGLIRNLPESRKLVERYDWDTLMGLRDAAANDGLAGEYKGLSVQRLSEQVVEIASDGLDASEQWMLAYPRFVNRTGLNGAVRARNAYEQSPYASQRDRIRNVVCGRIALNIATLLD